MKPGYPMPQKDDIYYPDPKKNDHDRIVLISRHMAAITAERLRGHPKIIDEAKKRLKRWMDIELEHGGRNSQVFLDWKKILNEKSLDEIIRLLLSETHDADRLRSSSPIMGVLTEEERLAIFKAHGPVPA